MKYGSEIVTSRSGEQTGREEGFHQRRGCAGSAGGLPTVRVIDRHQRATTFDLAAVVSGKRSVVPVVAVNMDLPIIKVGDEVTVLGHVRRRFFRVGARTQSVTEIVVEQIVTARKPQRLEALYSELASRVREARQAPLTREVKG